MIEPLHVERGNALLRVANVIVQVRTGAMTIIGLEMMHAAARRFRSEVSGKHGALMVLGGRAAMVAPIIRKRQIRGLQELVRDPLSSVCMVIDPTNPAAEIFRALARADQEMAPNGMICEDVDEGIRWLAEAVGDIDAAMIAEAEKHARRLADGA